MIRLFRYYVPYTAAILLAVALLFLQANLDLALPDYMSRIVNVGLQQGGVESPLATTLRDRTWQAIQWAAGPGAPPALATLYGEVDADGLRAALPGTSPLVEGDPALASALNKATLVAALVDADLMGGSQMGKALVGQGLVGSDPAGNAAAAEIPSGGTAVPSQGALPAPPDLPALPDFETLLALPPAQAEALRQGLGDAVDRTIPPTVQRAAAIQVVRSEYQAQGRDPGALQTSYILGVGLVMLGLTLVSALATIAVGYIGARFSAGVARTIRGDLFKKIEGFSLAEFDRFSTASLITRSTNDVTQVQTVLFLMIRMVIYAPIMGIGGVFRAVGKAPSMAWIIAVAVLVLLGIIGVVMAVALPRFKKIQSLVDGINRVAREQLSGLLVTRAFTREPFETGRFDVANRNLTDNSLFVARVMVVMMPVIMLIMNFLSVAIIWIGAQEVAASRMQVGDMMAFLQYAMQIVMSFLMLSMVFIMLPRAVVSGQRIAEVLETQPAIRDPEAPAILPEPVRGLVEFRNVTFRYPGADDPAVEGISFVAEPGKTTAIIGSTGSGKSSIVNLIPRFYDPEEGAILLDGVDIRSLVQADLRSQIGLVPQKNVLFTGTIADNLRFAKAGASDDELRSAATLAQALGFIEEREKGMDDPISQGGTNVSGGQRQRLAIARALVGSTPVLVFDDSFSALDFRTDQALRQALHPHTRQKTVIIVAQRVSTIMGADQILVLDEGRLVGRGRHEDLMETCLAYREIAVSQLGNRETT